MSEANEHDGKPDLGSSHCYPPQHDLVYLEIDGERKPRREWEEEATFYETEPPTGCAEARGRNLAAIRIREFLAR